MSLWYLSYADPERFRGVVILEAGSFVGACRKAKQQGLSPGGEVLGVPIPDYLRPEPRHIGVLFRTREAVQAALGPDTEPDGDVPDEIFVQFVQAGLVRSDG